jgi:hypothetical protein
MRPVWVYAFVLEIGIVPNRNTVENIVITGCHIFITVYSLFKKDILVTGGSQASHCWKKYVKHIFSDYHELSGVTPEGADL